MKKFLINRQIEEDSIEKTLAAMHNVSPEPPKRVDTRNDYYQEKVEHKLEVKIKSKELKQEVRPEKASVVQPPLPPYPPPPDSPPKPHLAIKLEKEDPEPSTDETPEPSDESQLTQQLIQPPGDKPSKPMCKEYIRGNCKRTVCKFAHETDLSQLRGVYTFCWQFQNQGCTYSNCRFVHATVFEEAEFYRTGILPPHARAHHSKGLRPPEESQQETATSYSNATPQLHPRVEKMPVISCVPASSLESRPVDESFAAIPTASALAHEPRPTSPLKRVLVDVENFVGNPPRATAAEPIKHLVKQCKNCETMEIRLQYNKEKVENMMHSMEEHSKKLALLHKKSSKLNNILLTLMKPTYNPKANSSIISGEKDQTLLEQLINFMKTNNRSSIVNEDTMKNILSSNVSLSSLMAKLLCGSGDADLPLATKDS